MKEFNVTISTDDGVEMVGKFGYNGKVWVYEFEDEEGDGHEFIYPGPDPREAVSCFAHQVFYGTAADEPEFEDALGYPEPAVTS